MATIDEPQANSRPAPAHARRALVLGVIALSSPLALNMYVPAFPRMAADLGTAPGEIQLSLTSLLAALAIGQNIYGPLSDRFGRKIPLYFGLGLFILASIAVAFADSLEALVAWRFVQGFGACAGMTIPRAVVRDLHTGAEAARILALMLLVISVAPLLAPMLGSALAAFSWRWIFGFMAATGALALLLSVTFLEETLPPARRHDGGVWRMIGGYRILLGDRHFVGLVLAMSMSQAAFFAYLGGSPFVFMTLHGFGGWQYSLLFGVTAAFWAIAAQLAPRMMVRLGARRLVIRCVLANAVTLALLLAAALLGAAGPWVIVAAIIPLFMASGMLIPTATVAALHRHGAVAGTASAVMGTGSFAAGGLASALVSALADHSARPMIAVMAGCGLLALGGVALAFAGRSGDDDLDEMGHGRGE